jgi:bifunctional DNA-binding transcriptional regulator/antitoxin component of YhaV-PrlF toxin-antitoxin module
MLLTISKSGQVVLPARLRKKYNYHPGRVMRIQDFDGLLILEPLWNEEAPVSAPCGDAKDASQAADRQG